MLKRQLARPRDHEEDSCWVLHALTSSVISKILMIMVATAKFHMGLSWFVPKIHWFKPHFIEKLPFRGTFKHHFQANPSPRHRRTTQLAAFDESLEGEYVRAGHTLE